MTMDRHTHHLVSEIITVLERHGHHARDREHADQAIDMAVQLAQVYDGTLDIPASTGLSAVPQPRSGPRSEPAPDALVLTGADISTVLAALSLASEYKRDLAETCADCADQSCASCEYRRKEAHSYERLSERIYFGPEPASHSQPEPDPPVASPNRADPSADKEAGQ